jgi:hypothetical protein
MASAAPKASTFKVLVNFEPREDGGLRAYSNDVPGFVLSYADCDTTIGAVVPVLETILSDMFNGHVRVTPLEDMRGRLENAGMISRKPKKAATSRHCPIAPTTREYAIEQYA